MMIYNTLTVPQFCMLLRYSDFMLLEDPVILEKNRYKVSLNCFKGSRQIYMCVHLHTTPLEDINCVALGCSQLVNTVSISNSFVMNVKREMEREVKTLSPRWLTTVKTGSECQIISFES